MGNCGCCGDRFLQLTGSFFGVYALALAPSFLVEIGELRDLSSHMVCNDGHMQWECGTGQWSFRRESARTERKVLGGPCGLLRSAGHVQGWRREDALASAQVAFDSGWS